MRNRLESVPDHRFLFEYIASKGVKKPVELARMTGSSEALVSSIRSGKREIAPGFLLKVLQAYPPADWNELNRLGEAWLPLLEQRKNREIRKLDTRNMPFFNELRELGLVRTGAIAEAFGVNKSYVSNLKSGLQGVSPRLMERLRALREARTLGR